MRGNRVRDTKVGEQEMRSHYTKVANKHIISHSEVTRLLHIVITTFRRVQL